MSFRHCAFALLLGACSSTPELDAGAAGFAQCTPAATGPQRCVDSSLFPKCRPTEAQTRDHLCALATITPHVSGWNCDEGIQWRAGVSPQETCSFVDGGLTGATIGFESNPSIAGAWQMHGCVQAELCPERDAGSCRPILNAFETCDDDLSHFGFCEPSETAQRTAMCSDAGALAYGRQSAACDGGNQLTTIVTGLGPTQTCFYVDGGFAGASDLDDTNRGSRTGVWTLPDCSPTPLCP